MRKLMLVLVVIGLLSLPLMAEDNSRFEVFGGYEYLHFGNQTINGQTVSNSSEGFNGWNAAGIFNFSRNFGVEGDFGGAYDTTSGVSTHIYTYTGGPVVSANLGNIRPFVHALAGGTHVTGSQFGVSASLNGLTVMAGGGVDFKVNRLFALRLIQGDWLYYRFGSTTIDGVAVPTISQSNNVRVSSGIVLRF